MAVYVGAEGTAYERLRKDEFQEKPNRLEEANRSPNKAHPRPVAIQPKELKEPHKADVEIARVKDRDPKVKPLGASQLS